MVKQSSLEIYFEWLDSLIERRVCEVRSPACLYVHAMHMYVHAIHGTYMLYMVRTCYIHAMDYTRLRNILSDIISLSNWYRQPFVVSTKSRKIRTTFGTTQNSKLRSAEQLQLSAIVVPQ